MSLHIALIDKSEVIQKMFLHCLYYYTVQVHRFNNFEEYLKHFDNKKPNLIFIDWEIKQGEQALIYTAIEQLRPTPLVLLYRKEMEKELSNIPKGQIPYRIKKPIKPKELRDISTELIPELKNSVLHSFLKFPKSAEEKEQEQNKPAPPPSTQKITEEGQENKTEKTRSFIGNLIEKTGLFKMPSPEEIELAQESPEPNEVSPSSRLNQPTGQDFQTATGLTSASSQVLKNKNTVKQTLKPSKGHPPSSHPTLVKTVARKEPGSTILQTGKASAVTPASSKEKPRGQGFQTATGLTSAPSNLKEKMKSPQKNSDNLSKIRKPFNKENINIDEDTQNDLAPMAIKSSPSLEKQPESPFSKQNVMLAFDKYKDSLEFQKLIEKTLAEYTQNVVSEILKGDSIKIALQKPLENFKESTQFKQLVEKEISQYIRTQLPLAIKSIVEAEIKKIIGD